jgi:MFS family permease
MMAIFSPLAGRWSDQTEPRIIASAGMAITASGLFVFAAIGSSTPESYIICTLAMLGFGFALFSSPNMNAIMSAVEKKYYGIASGTVATMRLLGQMTSMAIALVIFAIFIGREQISPSNYDSFLKSVQISFTIFASLCTLGIFFSIRRGALRKK